MYALAYDVLYTTYNRGTVVAANRTVAATIWARPEPAARNPRFSRDRIAAAALAIADAEGFEAVSMRRIAAALGAGTMSLYRYIQTKDDLLVLIDDAILGEALAPEPLPADWRAALALVARHTRAAYLRHPWAVRVLQGIQAAQPAVAGPGGLRHLEQSLAAVAGAPLDTAARLDLLAIVDDYIAGHLLHAARLATPGTGVPQPATSARADFGQARLASGEYPHVAGLASAGPPADDASMLDARFELGLRILIDGAAAVPG